MVRLKSALRRVLFTHCSIWLLLSAALPAIAVAETQYLYDDLGRLVLVAYPDGSAIAYEHDADGNIVAQHQWTAAGPVIATFSPAYGPAGTQVTISGVGFGATPEENTVTIGGAPAVVTSASDSTLIATVPLGADTGPISVVTGSNSATSAQNFVVLKPMITSFSPMLANPGDPVALQGSNLNLVPGSTSVSVAGVVASITSITNSDIVFQAPSGSGPVVVETSYGQAVSADYLTVIPASIGLENVVDLTTLEPDLAGSLSINQVDKYGLFEFDATQGQWLQLEITSLSTVPAGMDVSYELYSPTGESLSSGTVSSPVTLHLPLIRTTGRHLISFTSPGSTSVAVTAKLTPYPALNPDGTSHSFSSTVAGQNGYFTFSATAGEDLSLALTELTVSASNRVTFRVYRPDGTVWKSTYCRTSNRPGCAYELRNVPETGEYAVHIIPYSSGAQTSYVLTLSHHLAAGTLLLDTPKMVATTVPGQRAWLTFTLPTAQTVALAMDSIVTMTAGEQMHLTVFDSNGAQVRQTNSAGYATLNMVDLAADTYRVLLAPGDAATGSVQVTLASGMVGTLPADGTSQSFSSTVLNQNGYFTFSATAGEDLALALTELTMSYDNRVRLYVFQPSGGEWKDIYCRTSNLPGCSVELRDVPETGEYTVRVVPDSGAQTSYVLTLSHHLAAGTLLLDTPKMVATTVPGQRAWLTFTLPTAQTVALVMDSMYDSGGSQVAQTYGTSGSATLNLGSLAADTYTALLVPNDAATASAQVTLQ